MMSIRFSLTAWVVLAALAACGEVPKANGKTPTATAKADTHTSTQTQNVPANISQAITQTLETRYADQKLKVQSIATTPVSGWYEVVVNGKQIVYTDASAQYMFVGDLIATEDGRSLTEEAQAVLNKIDYHALPFDQAIKEVRGNGQLQVAVFSDPDCPFCKRLEHEFAKMTNITIYNFMMPIASLHPDAARKAVQIMCQPNPTQAWTAWMRENKMPPSVAQCDTTVAQTTALGESFGFNGTPTLVFPNGKTQSGYAPMPQLQAAIEANQK